MASQGVRDTKILHRGNGVDTKRRIMRLHLKSNDRFIVKEKKIDNNKAKKKIPHVYGGRQTFYIYFQNSFQYLLIEM